MKKEHYIALGILILVIVGQNLYFNHILDRNRKYFEKEITAIKDSILVKEDKESKIINNGKNYTKTASESKNRINKKLKDDEKIIDNRSVSDAGIDSLLTRFNKGSN